MMDQLSKNNDYINFLSTIKSEIQSAKIRAAKGQSTHIGDQSQNY